MKKKTYLKHKKAMNREIRNCKKLNCKPVIYFIMNDIKLITHMYKNGRLGRYYAEWLRCI